MTPSEENRYNEQFIRRMTLPEFTVVEIDAKKVRFHGRILRELSAYGRRKFENMLVITNAKTRLRFQYINTF